jgi:hypothetical protein
MPAEMQGRAGKGKKAVLFWKKRTKKLLAF